MAFKANTLLALEKENRMMGSSGTQLVFFKEDAIEALINFGFSEEETMSLLDEKNVLRDEIMNFEYRYSLRTISSFNVERKNIN